MSDNTQLGSAENSARLQLWTDNWFGRLPGVQKLSLAKPSLRSQVIQWLSVWSPAIFTAGSLACCLTLLHGFDWFMPVIQYWLIVCGTIQICAGTYLSAGRLLFLKNLQAQEIGRPMVHVREVMQIRFLLAVIEKLKAYEKLSDADRKGRDALAYLENIYSTEENEKSTPGKFLYHLNQEDLAVMFMASSFNVTYGTLFVLLGTFIAAVRELTHH